MRALKRPVVLFAALLLIALLALAAWAYWEHTVPAELVYEYRAPKPIDAPGWLTVYDTGFWTKDIFAERFLRETGQALDRCMTMDTENYTYIVCYGAKLERLVYCEGIVSGRFTGVYPWYYGFAYLRQDSPEDSAMVRIYRADKIRIENDPHSNDPACAVATA